MEEVIRQIDSSLIDEWEKLRGMEADDDESLADGFLRDEGLDRAGFPSKPSSSTKLV